MNLENIRQEYRRLIENFAISPLALRPDSHTDYCSKSTNPKPITIPCDVTENTNEPHKILEITSSLRGRDSKYRSKSMTKISKNPPTNMSDDSAYKTVSDDDEDKENNHVSLPNSNHIEDLVNFGTRQQNLSATNVLSPIHVDGSLNSSNSLLQSGSRYWCSICKSKICQHVSQKLLKQRAVQFCQGMDMGQKYGGKWQSVRSRPVQCSMCKTKPCCHKKSIHSPTPLVRSPCDGAPSSPKSSNMLRPNIDYDISMDLSENPDKNQHVLPVAPLLQKKLRFQSPAKVLSGLSLRGLDGTDLSIQQSTTPKSRRKTRRKQTSQVNIHDISIIKTKESNINRATSIISLRERPSTTNLADAVALHSTLNYPLHSTLNNVLGNTVSGIEPITRDLSGVTEQSNGCSSQWSFDDSINQSVNTYFGSRPLVPGAPGKDFNAQNSTCKSLSYSASDSSLFDDSSLLFGEELGPQNQMEFHKLMKRQTGQRSLQEVKTPPGLSKTDIKANNSDEMTLLADSNQYSINATRDSVPDVDVTIVPNMVLGALYRNNMPNKLMDTSENICENKMKNLDKTIHTGCMGLFKKKSSTKRRKTINQSENMDDTKLFGATSHCNLLSAKSNKTSGRTTTKKIIEYPSNIKSRVALKRKLDHADSNEFMQSVDVSETKKTCKRSLTLMCHATPKSSGNLDGQLSKIKQNTPRLQQYEFDRQVNVIPDRSTPVCIGADRKKEVSRRMKQFNRTLQEGTRPFLLERL